MLPAVDRGLAELVEGEDEDRDDGAVATGGLGVGEGEIDTLHGAGVHHHGPGQQVGLASGASEPTEAESQNGTLEHVIAAVVLRQHARNVVEDARRRTALPNDVVREEEIETDDDERQGEGARYDLGLTAGEVVVS